VTDADADGSPEASGLAGWPARWSGVAESVVTTAGPDGRWNVAALGLYAPDAADRPGADGPETGSSGVPGPPVTARTWGRTRTRRNLRERGEGYVQFTRDPVDFVEAACSVRTETDPVLDGADAWTRATARRRDAGETDGTEWADWALAPVEAGVDARVVPTASRAGAAVIEATVAASRLDVPGYDAGTLRDRIAFFGSVVESAGGPRHRVAWERFESLVDWRADDGGD
jgi:hypothetical protein